MPQVLEIRCGLHPGIDHAVVAPQQLCAAVAADLAKLVVGVGNVTGQVGDADDGVLVQRKFLVGQVGQCRLQIALACLALRHQV